MIPEIIFIISACMSTSISGQNTLSPDALAVISLIPTMNTVDLFNGPSNISQAATSPTTNSRPSLERIAYFNYYAASVYCRDELENLSCPYCENLRNDVTDKEVLTDNYTETLALVTLSVKRKEIVVTFRGTSNIWNIVVDFTTIAVTYPNTPSGIKLHAGFYTAARALYDEVITNVGFLHTNYRDYKIVFVGHSLGGAMARITLFFVLILNQFPGAIFECYTYGEPRSGNKAYVDFMNKQSVTTVRVVSRADIVPHVPPTSLLGTNLLGDFYYHCQTEYWTNGYCDPSVYEDPNCSNSLEPSYTIDDHTNYLNVKYGNCSQPGLIGDLATIPDSINKGIGNIPPLPQLITNYLAAAANFVFKLIGIIP